ncbi:hypothetical protein LTR91_019204 [Friedmanniomyces endolithicus]|uniref:LisH domain-containing protein n=1 Tax=Friedmanniomyces endolithicus TaxID=329885 RepID=A0AAN6F7S9_9PEZI|nr:hypothetical protein LTS00_014964 [Friedmanniomyces endolithicus]KAK0281573.1 hypothetical protein LTR35_007252 [Friedmanniomyces endolithicus]KAK0308646.1 hypothetical protein LTR82_015458 [Friedmanniomyces endolithicus]KAK0315426.1 hypothetical protein LTR01_000724 [Friedmanniomyces endolithicus]KAK0827079.1 hypothetical protein LTR73_005862 [Friedmanniomyces endolithicus]
MPATDSPAIIVARFLKSSNYTETYDAFIAEAGLPSDAGAVSKGDLTIEQLLEEKKTFDLSRDFEKLGLESEDDGKGWLKPVFEAPEHAQRVSSLPSSSNILSVAVHTMQFADGEMPALFATSADRRLHILDASTMALQASLAGLQDSPMLSCVVFRRKHLLTAAMSGQLLVSNMDGSTVESRRDHTKYIVRVAVRDDAIEPLIATAGWDGKIMIYRPSVTTSGEMSLGDPKVTITVPTKPEAMIFIEHPDAQQPILLVTRTDSSFLYYYTTESEPRLLGRQNLAPHSNAWVAFTPSALALSPRDPTLVAVGTSTVPHMKLLLVRLLIPSYDQQTQPTSQPDRTSPHSDPPIVPDTQSSQARRELALADRESAAIQIHCTTMAPQTAYSTPAVAWRPDGSGVWVNGDDGAVRGVEVSSGKVVCTLLGGHEAGSKVRCLWAGRVGDGEVLVSGGFDQRLVVWRAGVVDVS